MCLCAWLAGDVPVAKGAEARRARYLMGTLCSARTAHPDAGIAAAAADSALDEIARAEALLSTWREDTELSRMNRRAGQGPVEVSQELAGFLRLALSLAGETRGAFDPTVGALVDAYDLRGQGRLPSSRELRGARRASGWGKVHLRGTRISFARPGLWLDPGGIGKGWALDRAGEVLRQEGIDSALLDCGGQLLAIGSPPGEDAWRVAVADPRLREETALVLLLRDASAATSGLSERSPRVEGSPIGHVLDPRTGRPLGTDATVTVVAASGAEADALATAMLVMGPRRGQHWLSRRQDVEAGWLLPRDEGLELVATDEFHRWCLTGAAAQEILHPVMTRRRIRP